MTIPKKILLVDDDSSAIFLTRRVLQRAQVPVDIATAADGQEALTIVAYVCAQEQCPELILLDIHMPVMDGFEFLEALQQSASLNKAPIKIVLLSSSTHYLDLARSKKYPVLDCLEKPLTLEKLTPFL